MYIYIYTYIYIHNVSYPIVTKWINPPNHDINHETWMPFSYQPISWSPAS